MMGGIRSPFLTPDDRDEIVRLLVSGVPPVEIAEKFNCDSSYPRSLARKRGVISQIPVSVNAQRQETRRVRAAAKAAAAERANGLVFAMTGMHEPGARAAQSFTAVFCGDPPPGRSALDQKMQGAGA